MSAAPRSAANGPGIGRVVAGVDGSEPSLAAARWAAEYASLRGAELRLVTGWHWPALLGAAPAPAVDFEGDARAVAAGVADQLRQELPDLDIGSDVVFGPPAEVLVGESKGADLLVVGSRGHGAFSGMLIGSVSLHCVHNAPCPVVVVRGAPDDVPADA